MKRRQPRKQTANRTGEHCRHSGWWAHEGDGGSPRFITEGGLMPAVAGQPGRWQFVLEGRPSGPSQSSRAQHPRSEGL